MARSFEEVVELYDIQLLRGGLDLAVENGDLAVTRWGDLQLGSKLQSALWRLVQHWRFSESMLRSTFAAASTEMDRFTALEKHEDRLTVRLPYDDDGWRKLIADRHAIRDDQASATFGARLASGFVILGLDALLRQLADDSNGNAASVLGRGPQVSQAGVPFGSLVNASANAVRHSDEWIKCEKPSTQQARSMNVVAAALNREVYRPGGSVEDIALDVLSLLSSDSFDVLAMRFFACAQAIASS